MLSKNTIYVLLDSYWTIAFNFLIYTLAARNFAQDDWGAYSAAFAFISVVVSFGSLGLDYELIKRVTKAKNKLTHFMIVLTLRLLAVVSAFFVSFITIFALSNEDLLQNYYIAGFLLSLGTVANLTTNNFLVATERSKIAFFSRLTTSVLFTVLKLLAIYYFNSISMLVIVSGIELISFVFLAMLIYVRKDQDRKLIYRLNYLKIATCKYAKKCLPLAMMATISMAHTRIDQVFIYHYVSNIETAYYAVAIRVLDAFLVTQSILITGVYTKIIKLLKKRDCGARQIQNIYFQFIGIFLILSILIFIFSENLFVMVFGIQYEQSSFYFVLFTPFLVLTCISNLNAKLIYAKGLERHLVVVTFVSAVLNVALNIYLIPIYGTVGAIAATTLAMMYTSLMADLLINETRFIARIRFLGRI